MSKVRVRRRGTSTITSQHQITLPVDALREAGLSAGDRLVVRADGAGRMVLQREHDVVSEFSGALTGTYRPDELSRLRDEWD
jgi:bifunctional DNA-binding transcriptional regulator/antitoxin component of YhaV-PrlF toxin-antitoxin module